MRASIKNAGGSGLQEFYLNKESIKDGSCRNLVKFVFDISHPQNDVRRFWVSIYYRIENSGGDIISRLETKTEFDLKGITTDQDSFKVLEQCAYLAFSDMLKHHSEKYKTWSDLYEDIVMPDNDVISAELNKLLLSLPY